MSAIEVELKHPISVILRSSGGEREEKIEKVSMRPVLKAKDLRAMDGHEGEIAKSIALVATLSGLTIAQVDELHPEDFERLVDIGQGFTPPGPPTGSTSSA